jgi:hypothetical protein
VDQLLEHSPFVIAAAGRQSRALQRIQHAKQVLPLAENNLRGSPRPIAIAVLYQV